MKLGKETRGSKADRSVIGLDIGSDSIKMVRGFKAEGKIRVLDFACRKYLPSEATPELLSLHLHELLASILNTKQIKTSRIHALISGRKLCIRVVKLPIMPEQEIYQAIRSKIRKYVSPDLDQVKFSFSVIGETQEEGIKKLEVVFAALQKTIFDECLQLFNAAGAQPAAITSACFSEWKLVQEIGLDRGASSWMLINIENQETDLTVYREGQFIFTRTISIGENTFADIFKGQPQLSLSNERDLRQIWGLEAEAASVSPADKARLAKIKEQLQAEADVLCKEIELTVHHYYQITHGQRIDKSIVLGAGSQVAGLMNYLKQKLEIPVEGLNFSDARLELAADKKEAFEKDFPLYTQALGAMLVAPADINLLVQMKSQAKMGVNLLKVSGLPKKIIISVASLALLIFICLKGVNLYYQFRIKSYERMRGKLSGQTEQLVRVKRKEDILDFEKKFYLKLIREYPSYPIIIAEILKAIPSPNIVLDEFKFYGDANRISAKDTLPPLKFTIMGRVSGKDLTGSETTNFVLALEQGGYFENISVTISDYGGYAELENMDRASKKGKELGFIVSGGIKLKD